MSEPKQSLRKRASQFFSQPLLFQKKQVEIKQEPRIKRAPSKSTLKQSEVTVSPSYFDKIKLIGKGDVGSVYLVVSTINIEK